MHDVAPISEHNQLVIWKPADASVDFALIGRKLLKVGRTALLIWGGVSLLGVGAYGFGAIGHQADPEASAAVALPTPIANPVGAAVAASTVKTEVAMAKPVSLPAPASAPVKVASKPARVAADAEFADEDAPAAASVPADDPTPANAAARQPLTPVPVAVPIKRPPLPAATPAAEETFPAHRELTVARLPRPRPEAPIITGSLRERVAPDNRRRRQILRFGPPLDYYRYARRAPMYYPGPEFPFYER